MARCAKAFQLLMGELGPVNNISHLVDTKLGEGKSKKVPRQILITVQHRAPSNIDYFFLCVCVLSSALTTQFLLITETFN